MLAVQLMCAHNGRDRAVFNNNNKNMFNLNLDEVVNYLSAEVRQIVAEEIRAAFAEAKNEPQKMYSRTEACKVLHITVPTLWRWEKEGLIKGQRAGRRVLFSTEEINRVMQKKGVKS